MTNVHLPFDMASESCANPNASGDLTIHAHENFRGMVDDVEI